MGDFEKLYKSKFYNWDDVNKYDITQKKDRAKSKNDCQLLCESNLTCNAWEHCPISTECKGCYNFSTITDEPGSVSSENKYAGLKTSIQIQQLEQEKKNDKATIQKLYEDDYMKTIRLTNDNEKKIHDEKLNIINNTKKLLKSKNNLLNISREIDINDEEFKFRNNVSNMMGIIIIIGIIITLVIVCNYLISQSSGKVANLKAIFG